MLRCHSYSCSQYGIYLLADGLHTGIGRMTIGRFNVSNDDIGHTIMLAHVLYGLGIRLGQPRKAIVAIGDAIDRGVGVECLKGCEESAEGGTETLQVGIRPVVVDVVSQLHACPAVVGATKYPSRPNRCSACLRPLNQSRNLKPRVQTLASDIAYTTRSFPQRSHRYCPHEDNRRSNCWGCPRCPCSTNLQM